MSKLLELTAEIVVNEQTGKRRVMTHIYRDETLDLSFVLQADEAEQWGAKLMYLANECRKKTEPAADAWHKQILKNARSFWTRLFQ